jgi:peptidoglycan-binding protein ArfA
MVDSEVGVGEAPTPARPISEPQLTPQYHRQAPGRPWLIGLAVIPFLLALIGFGTYERPMAVNGPTGDLPTLTATRGATNTSSLPSLSLSLLSISRSGNSITLIGDFPNEIAKATLMNSLRTLMTPGVSVVDQINIDPLVHSLDFANAEPVFAAGAAIPDFSLKVEKDTITLGGTAPSREQKDAVQRAAATTWPGVNVANKIIAKGGKITPGAQAPPPPPAPVPGPAACNDLQAAVNALTGGPIVFENDGVSLTAFDKKVLIEVADKLKACPAARLTVNGYTDNSGSEAMNIPLSTQRAAAVADYLVANGVARDRVTAKGLGSVNPIASNDTADGRIKNRRVDLVVG